MGIRSKVIIYIILTIGSKIIMKERTIITVYSYSFHHPIFLLWDLTTQVLPVKSLEKKCGKYLIHSGKNMVINTVIQTAFTTIIGVWIQTNTAHMVCGRKGKRSTIMKSFTNH